MCSFWSCKWWTYIHWNPYISSAYRINVWHTTCTARPHTKQNMVTATDANENPHNTCDRVALMHVNVNMSRYMNSYELLFIYIYTPRSLFFLKTLINQTCLDLGVATPLCRDCSCLPSMQTLSFNRQSEETCPICKALHPFSMQACQSSSKTHCTQARDATLDMRLLAIKLLFALPPRRFAVLAKKTTQRLILPTPIVVRRAMPGGHCVQKVVEHMVLGFVLPEALLMKMEGQPFITLQEGIPCSLKLVQVERLQIHSSWACHQSIDTAEHLNVCLIRLMLYQLFCKHLDPRTQGPSLCTLSLELGWHTRWLDHFQSQPANTIAGLQLCIEGLQLVIQMYKLLLHTSNWHHPIFVQVMPEHIAGCILADSQLHCMEPVNKDSCCRIKQESHLQVISQAPLEKLIAAQLCKDLTRSQVIMLDHTPPAASSGFPIGQSQLLVEKIPVTPDPKQQAFLPQRLATLRSLPKSTIMPQQLTHGGTPPLRILWAFSPPIPSISGRPQRLDPFHQKQCLNLLAPNPLKSKFWPLCWENFGSSLF